MSSMSCPACQSAGNLLPSSAAQLEPVTGCNGTRCLLLGSLQEQNVKILSSDNPGVTLRVEIGGGDAGRKIIYEFSCDKSVDPSAGPTGEVVESPRLTYTVQWPSPLACPTYDAHDKTCGPPPPPIAAPTRQQLMWIEDELAAIGHFNMGTFQACGIGSSLHPSDNNLQGITLPSPETFAPTSVDAESWVKSLSVYGAKHAVLVVSHGCGFNTFPSRTAFPEFGFEYNYTIKNSPWKNGTGDIAREFVDACKKYNIRPGFYHGAMNNAFLNVVGGVVQTNWIPGQARLTQDQYIKVLLANLRQLWTDYGELAEVWFDGGVPEGSGTALADLLKELQPNAVAFQGTGENIVRWAGTESGHTAYPFWSATDLSGGLPEQGPGSPTGAKFAQGEADTCFQTGNADDSVTDGVTGPYGGCWFYNPSMVPKSLDQLISTYHDSVGHNALLLLDWTPTPNGTLRTDHVERYQEFGDWLRACYSIPVASTGNVTVGGGSGNIVSLAIPAGSQFDRVVIQEDQTTGQRIQSYSINFVDVNGTTNNVGAGVSIGHKRIQLLQERVTGASKLLLNVTSILGNTTIRKLAVYNCSQTPTPSGCTFQNNFAYKIVPSILIKTITSSDPTDCCSACRGITECAVFVVSVDTTCTLLSANQGGEASPGVLSGSPK